MPAATLSPALIAQVDAYVAADYPALAGLTESAFRSLFDGLAVPNDNVPDAVAGQVPFVAVVTSALVPAEARVPLLRLTTSDRPGILDRNHGEEGLAPYRPVDGLDVPDAPVYLLTGIDRGDEFRDVAPRDALPVIASRGRTPLTIDEGLSLATVFPELLVKNHCFMLAGSTRGDKRVPALWISERAPKLGWCFQGVPHSWLGVASARGRAGNRH